MKKGLFITLVLSALLATSAFAYSPVLDTIPDVVIGDADETGFWTTDVNFFRFTDAFAFDDYVTDQDSTPSTHLKWCFIEGTSGVLEINEKPELDIGSEDPKDPPAGKDVRDGNATASFRDIGASPKSYDAAVLAGTDVYPGSPLCDQLITFWVSDEANNADSQTIYVKSIDGDVDRLSQGVQEVKRFGFDTGPEDFGWGTITGFSLPRSRQKAGAIGLQDPTGGIGFGFWQTPGDHIAYEAGKIFRARFALMRDAALTSADDMPTIRLRWISNNFTGSTSYYINSVDPFNQVPPIDPSTEDYGAYFYPITDPGGLGLAMDMLDFSPETGTVWCDEIVVEKIDRSYLSFSAVGEFDTNFGTWSFNPNFGAFGDVSSAGSGASSLALTSTVADAANAGFHQCADNALAYDTATALLYRASFDLSRAGTNGAIVPTIRLRAFNEDNQMVAAFNMQHGATGAGAPAQGGSTVEVLWDRPDLPASPTTAQDGFKVAFDMLDFAPTEGDTVTLDKVTVESTSIP
jgi:hypothetical protein